MHMSCSPLNFLSVSIYIIAISSISLQLPNPAVQLSLPPTNLSAAALPSASVSFSTNLSSTNTSHQALNATHDVPVCLSHRYGMVSKESCRDAWNSIPADSTTRYVFGARAVGYFEVPLPHRFLSCTFRSLE